METFTKVNKQTNKKEQTNKRLKWKVHVTCDSVKIRRQHDMRCSAFIHSIEFVLTLHFAT